jgi:hypothetical protein
MSGKNAVGEPANFEVHPYSPVQTAKQNIAARLLAPIVVEDIANGSTGWRLYRRCKNASRSGRRE